MLPDIIEGKKVEELRDLVNIMREQQPQTRDGYFRKYRLA